MGVTILHFLIFFGPLFAVIISIGQLVQVRKGFVDYLFSLSFFGMGIWMIQISLYATGIFDSWNGIYYLITSSIPFAFLVPPVMVLRYKWILSSVFHLKPRHLLLFLPACISALLLLLPPLLIDIPGPDGMYPGLPVMTEKFSRLPLYYKCVYTMLYLPNVYLVLFMSPHLATMSLVWRKNYSLKFTKAARMGYLFALSIVTSNSILIAGAFFSFGLIKIAVLMANIATIMVYLVTKRNPDYLRLLQSETRKAHYEKSRIRGLNVQQITTRLNEIMEDEKAFADEELSLRDLAQELGISTHQLSEILNEKLNKNFKTFINEYRIEEAKKLLIDEPDRSILSIGVAVGFNSNTTFCTVFSKHTGISPRQFRKHQST
ncbi:MAG TPA: helix-turn-helix domain-containing protein [Spirochaetota bacterium]|nr:helix-turn-helix domain-containing protein [Spirochaetota bacterium]